MTELTPREIVGELDRYIIGQSEAKRAVALALRHRWRRMQLEPAVRAEIFPKNILMIGPTGVGKTEIARRIAGLSRAPFIKVEATKYTEVGYVGKEVESIIKELAEVAMKQVSEEAFTRNRHRAEDAAEERILDALVGPASAAEEGGGSGHAARQIFRKRLREHELDEREIEIRLAERGPSVNVIGSHSAFDEVTSHLQSIMDSMNAGRTVQRKMKVRDALRELVLEEAEKLTRDEDLKSAAVELCESQGIVFIDEIDKICGTDAAGSRGEVSRQGVQRDLLPLIEGTQVRTKYGMVSTEHILFITSGAFQMSRPSDLIPELQGRLPIRVELKALTAEDFERILKEPHTALTRQYQLLLATEGIEIEFTDDAIRRIAHHAFQVNERTENIGARRLHTLMEKLLETLSFEAPDRSGLKVCIDEHYVDEHLSDLVADEDLSRYIL